MRLLVGKFWMAFSCVALVSACTDDKSAGKPHEPIDGGGDGATGPLPLANTACQAPDAENFQPVPIDLDGLIGSSTGAGVTAKAIENASELIGGEAAQGRVCDFSIANDSVRFIVQGPDRTIGPGPFGGNVIDGDIVRADGSGHDVIGEVTPFIQLGRTFDARRIDVIRDGSHGGPAVIAATGPDELLDYIDVKSVIGDFVGMPVQLPVNAELDLPVTVTNYFILEPGKKALREVTAIRNDGTEELVLSVGDLIDSGGNVEFFNPANTTGFGYTEASPELLDLLGFRGPESSYAYAPAFKDGAPAAAYMVFAGVAGVLVGPTAAGDALATLFAPELTRDSPGVLVVAPGEVGTYERWISVGDGSLATATAPAREARGNPLGAVDGHVVDGAGNGVASARVSAIDSQGRTETQFLTASDGSFSGSLAPGDYSFEATTPGRTLVTPGVASVTAGQTAMATTTMSAETAVHIQVHSPSGTPLPARVSFLCVTDCPEERRSQLRDVSFDEPGGNLFRVEFIDNGGDRTIPIPAGSYRVVVSRGITYSVFPTDYPTSGGAALDLAPGDTGSLDVTLAKVVDTSGYLGADFHVHAVNSPDSPVPNRDRVITFLGGGVDVLVSSDHDYITDFAPIVSDLGAGAYIKTVRGVELTTFNYGHFNAFPLVPDDSINGGAFDWAGGTGPNVHPDVFLKALENDYPGEQVVQVNHASSGFQGYFAATKLDVATGATLADPAAFRLEQPAGATETDTKLFSGAFTAMEIMNGLGVDGFYQNLNYFLGFLNRGFVKTATAVTDTHQWRNSQGGMPRSFVEVGAGRDSVATFDDATFASAINAHHLFGTSGPFLRFSAESAGTAVPMGGVLAVASPGQPVTLTVEVQTPGWFKVNRVELYSNVTDTIPGPGEISSTPPTPVDAVDFVFDDATELVDGAEGGASFKRYLKTLTFSVAPTSDSYYIVMVRGDDSLQPVISSTSPKPLAFSNPIFVDVDGGGFGGI